MLSQPNTHRRATLGITIGILPFHGRPGRWSGPGGMHPPGIQFSDARKQAAEFIGYDASIKLTPEQQKIMHIAAPMVGGVVTSFLLELLIYPVIFTVWKWHREVKPGLAPVKPPLQRVTP